MDRGRVMACCKAEEYGGWCAQEPASFTDSDGKCYCDFHAPKEGKNGSAEEFNKKVFDLIDAAIAEGKGCDLSGTVFPWPINFTNYGEDRPLPPINLFRVTFEAASHFKGATFSCTASFAAATFKSYTTFSDATFCGRADFSYTTFSSSETHFAHTTFSDRTNFTCASLNGIMDFLFAVFKGESQFERATFSDGVIFWNATFNGAAFFSYADLSGESSFMNTVFTGPAFFVNAVFNGTASFMGTTFGYGATFLRASFNDRTCFESTQFGLNTTFELATFNNVTNFMNNITTDDRCAVLFHNVKTGKDAVVFFRDIKFPYFRCSFLGTNLANFCFDQCVWPRKEYLGALSWIISKVRFTTEENVIFYDENQASQGHDVGPGMTDLTPAQQLQRIAMIEDLYRQMKVKSKGAHNEPEASRWHYREKEMFRKKNLLRRYNPLSITNLYWAFSGYGERPIRAGFVLLLLFVTIGLAMNGLGLSAETGEIVIQGFSFSPDLQKIGRVTQSVVEHALFVKDPCLNAQSGWASAFFTLWTKILIPVQAALFAFALRNKFRR